MVIANPPLTEKLKASLDKKREDAKSWKEYREVTKRFKPRKSEYNSFVFLAAAPFEFKGKKYKKGDRVPFVSKRKAYPIYVKRPTSKHPKGSFEPSWEYELKKYKTGKRKGQIYRVKRAPKPLRAASFSPSDTGKKIAAQKYVAERRQLLKPVSIQNKSGKNIDFKRTAVPQFVKVLKRISNQVQSGKSFHLDCYVHITTSDGKYKSIKFSVDFFEQDKQMLTTADYKKFVEKKVYAYLAEALSAYDYVSQGSANYIKKLTHNKGLTQSKWTRAGGEEWGKNDYQTVSINKIEIMPSVINFSKAK